MWSNLNLLFGCYLFLTSVSASLVSVSVGKPPQPCPSSDLGNGGPLSLMSAPEARPHTALSSPAPARFKQLRGQVNDCSHPCVELQRHCSISPAGFKRRVRRLVTSPKSGGRANMRASERRNSFTHSVNSETHSDVAVIA